MIPAYPLTWPKERIRSRASEQERSAVKTAPATLWASIHRELKQWKTGGIVSSNLLLKKDGSPAAKQPRMDDSGVAVYFYFNGTYYGLAIDHFKDVAGNLKEIRDMLAYIRRLNRVFHRGAMLAMLTSFATIEQPRTTQQPPPKQKPPPRPEAASPKPESWRAVLELGKVATWTQTLTNYRKLAKRYHPDKSTSSTEKFQRLQKAYEEAKIYFSDPDR